MCRLFAMSGGRRAVRATFWLLDAPDSLAMQSRREPDGTGLGVFAADGAPQVHRRAVAAYEDLEFAREAKEVQSRTFVAHVRYATTGAVTARNTHPFEQHGRLCAHNGVVGGLEDLDAALGDDLALVHGETDSERVFALVTRCTEAAGGDVTRGIADAIAWIDAHLPVYAVNLVLADADEVWALRWPAVHELWVLERAAGGPTGGRHLDHASAAGTVRVRSGDLASAPSVVVASERMDEDPGWRLLDPGELLHVDPDLRVSSTTVAGPSPSHPLELDPPAAAAQAPRPA